MRKFILALTAAATMVPLTISTPPALAQSRGDVREEWREEGQARRDFEEERREAQTARGRDNRREEWREAREARREWQEERREAQNTTRDYRGDRRADRGDWRGWRNYDYNRPDRRYGGYDASRYYRDGRYYRERRLSYNDRIYRGNDGRYYCRRSDGTTGLILGALAGGLLGNSIDRGRSSTVGTVIGASGGALIGRSIERGEARCR